MWSEQLRQIGASSADVEAVIDSMALGGLQPPVNDLVDTPSGRVWLRRDATPTPEGARWWVLDLGRRTPVAEVLVPGNTRIAAVREDQAWGVRTDSLDIPYVVRFRVERR